MAKCRSCDRKAVCVGRYEVSEGPFTLACGRCCGHGNEDGQCAMLGDAGGLLDILNREAMKAAKIGTSSPDRHGEVAWLVVINREGATKATAFVDERDARAFFASASTQWSESYLCEVKRGPLL